MKSFSVYNAKRMFPCGLTLISFHGDMPAGLFNNYLYRRAEPTTAR